MQQTELIHITSILSVPYSEILLLPRLLHTVVQRHVATRSFANSTGRQGLTSKMIQAAPQAVHCSDVQRVSPLILQKVSRMGGVIALCRVTLSMEKAYLTASGLWAEMIPTCRVIPFHMFGTIPSAPAMAYLISSSSPHTTRALASSIPPAGPMLLFCKLTKET